MLTMLVAISVVVSWIYGNIIHGQQSDPYHMQLLQRIFLSVLHLRPLVRGCMVCAATLQHEQLYGIYKNYGLESPRLLKRGMKSRSLFRAWGWVGLAHFSVIRGVVAQDIFGWSHC